MPTPTRAGKSLSTMETGLQRMPCVLCNALMTLIAPTEVSACRSVARRRFAISHVLMILTVPAGLLVLTPQDRALLTLSVCPTRAHLKSTRLMFRVSSLGRDEPSEQSGDREEQDPARSQVEIADADFNGCLHALAHQVSESKHQI